MPKNQSKTTEKKTSYKRIETNIYKTGKSYRVRVGHNTANTPTLKQARSLKKMWKTAPKSTFIW